MITLKFVMVGHVDHGKSTLIGRLLYDTNSLPSDKIEEIKKVSKDLGRETEFAYLLDHLEEERRQGITIDTTQAFFKTRKRQYVIIDAPGHVKFVKNMITGASQAEAGILIIDVKEGVKEQTKRHAYILSSLGLNQVIVVLNKMDLVNFRKESFNNVKKDVEEFFSSISKQPAFCIPICAIKGDNIAKKSEKMNWYQGPTFLESLDTLQNREPLQDKPLIFPMQDVYKINDKRVAVGRIEAGIIRKEQAIRILPGRQSAKVKSIEKYLKELDEAYAGESIGITIDNCLFLNRGDVICEQQKEPTLTDNFKADIFWMSKKELKKDEKIILQCATQETICKVGTINKRIDSSSLEIIEEQANILKNLEVGEVIIKTKKPIAIKSFNDVQELGRFVLIQDENICAGGIITSVN
ncbi:MAG: sulfate adenylyltransferase subunit 1 [bacterium]